MFNSKDLAGLPRAEFHRSSSEVSRSKGKVAPQVPREPSDWEDGYGRLTNTAPASGVSVLLEDLYWKGESTVTQQSRRSGQAACFNDTPSIPDVVTQELMREDAYG